MTKKILIFLFALVTGFVVYYIDNGIRTHNLDFYSGKDGGYFLRVQSILLLSGAFFFFHKLYNKNGIILPLIHGFLGATIGLVISIIAYLIIWDDPYGTIFHITVLVSSCLSYYVFRRIKMMFSSTKDL